MDGLLGDVAKKAAAPKSTSPDSGASSDTARATIRELQSLLEAQTDLLEAVIAEEKPDASAASGSGNAPDHDDDSEPEPNPTPQPVKGDAKPPTLPKDTPPVKAKSRNVLAGLLLGKR